MGATITLSIYSVTPVLQSSCRTQSHNSKGYPLFAEEPSSFRAVRLWVKAMEKGVRVNLLCDLAPKFDQYLRQSGTTTLQPWQQEIRDYISTAKKPTFFAQNNLLEWGKRKGFVK
jgi:hypothetical protein